MIGQTCQTDFFAQTGSNELLRDGAESKAFESMSRAHLLCVSQHPPHPHNSIGITKSKSSDLPISEVLSQLHRDLNNKLQKYEYYVPNREPRYETRHVYKRLSKIPSAHIVSVCLIGKRPYTIVSFDELLFSENVRRC